MKRDKNQADDDERLIFSIANDEPQRAASGPRSTADKSAPTRRRSKSQSVGFPECLLLLDPRQSSRFRFDAEPHAVGFDKRTGQKSIVIQAEGWERIWRRCPLSGRRGLVSADAGGKVFRSLNAQSFIDAFNHSCRIAHQLRVRHMCDPAARRMVERHHLRHAALREANNVLHRGAVGGATRPPVPKAAP